MSKSVSNLKLDIISAKGFTQKSSLLQIHVLFRNQLLRSSSIEWVDEDPIFNISFNLNLYQISFKEEDDPTILIYISTGCPETQWSQRTSSLIAAGFLDYRIADGYPSDFISVELLPCVDGDGIGENISMSGGLLFLRVSRSDTSSNNINQLHTPEEAQFIMARRQEDLLQSQREFIQAAKQSWASVQKKHNFLQDRNVKILAKDECGHYRFVGSFLNPMKSPRSLINPRFAARFVSLIPLKKDLNMTGISEEVWHCPHAFLSRY